MKVVLSPRARDDLRGIQTYIAFDNVAAAARVASRIRRIIAMLEYHPKIGEVHKCGPERCPVVPNYPYCVYYDLDEQAGEINVLTVLHTRRLPPNFPS